MSQKWWTVSCCDMADTRDRPVKTVTTEAEARSLAAELNARALREAGWRVPTYAPPRGKRQPPLYYVMGPGNGE